MNILQRRTATGVGDEHMPAFGLAPSSTVVGKQGYEHFTEEDLQTENQPAAPASSEHLSLEIRELGSQGEPCRDQACSKTEWCFFFVFGMGPGYVMLDSLFIELPWFQAALPEGLRLGSHMAFAAATGLLAVPLYLILRKHVQYCWIVPLLTASNFFLALATASAWSCVVGEVSLAVLLVTLLASSAGNMQTVVILPWLSCSVKPRLLSAVMSGSNFASLSSAALSMLQGPGKHQLFSPSIFFVTLSILLMLPIFAYRRIETKRMGRPDIAEEQPDTLPSQSSAAPESSSHQADCLNRVRPQFWRRARELCAINTFLQVYCWAVLRAVLPFAAANVARRRDEIDLCDKARTSSCATSGMGSDILESCIEFSYLGVCAGSFASAQCKTSSARGLYPYLAAFILLACLVSSAALGLPLWQRDGADSLLVLMVVAIRFIDGLLSPLLFRIVAVEFSDECEEVSQWIAAVEKMSTLLATTLVFFLVQSAA